MTNAERLAFHRTAAAFHLAEVAALEGRPASTYLGQILPRFDTDEAERRRLAEIANSEKPRPWVDLAPGTGGQAGDNDRPDDDLLRAFGPFMDSLTAARDPIQTDSKGERWVLQTIKKRANEEVGFGAPAWGVVRDEIRRAWFTPWAIAWRTNADNIAAGLVPKADVVDSLFSKSYR